MSNLLNTEDEMLIALEKIFNDNDFIITSSLTTDVQSKPESEDMFLRYSDEYKHYIVSDKTGDSILSMYLLIEMEQPAYYIAYAEFSKYKGRKYGTEVVRAISESSLTKELWIADRSDIIENLNKSVWQHIIDKFPQLDYTEL